MYQMHHQIFFFCMKISYFIIALRNIEKLDNVFSHDEYFLPILHIVKLSVYC